MSGVVNQAGSRSGIVGHMADAVMLRRDHLPSSGAYEVKNIFRTEFKTYEIRFSSLKFGTDDTQLRFEFSGDNGSSWVTGNNYDSQVLQMVTGSAGSPINIDGGAYAVVGGYGNQGSAGNENSAGSVWIYDPLNGTHRKQGYNQWMIWKYTGHTTVNIGTFSYESSDPYNACKFYPSQGSFDVTGNAYGAVSLWGYR